MSFKVLKLVTEENIIADVYKRHEIEYFLKYFDESTVLEELNLIGENTSLILLEPMIIEEIQEKGRIFTVINNYLPYSSNEFLILPERNIIHISEPKESILSTYNQYILEIRKKEIVESVQKKLTTIGGEKLTVQEMVIALRLLTSSEPSH